MATAFRGNRVAGGEALLDSWCSELRTVRDLTRPQHSNLEGRSREAGGFLIRAVSEAERSELTRLGASSRRDGNPGGAERLRELENPQPLCGCQRESLCGCHRDFSAVLASAPGSARAGVIRDPSGPGRPSPRRWVWRGYRRRDRVGLWLRLRPRCHQHRWCGPGW